MTHVSDLLGHLSFPIKQHVESPLNLICQKWNLPSEYSAPMLIQKAHERFAPSLQQDLTDAIHSARWLWRRNTKNYARPRRTGLGYQTEKSPSTILQLPNATRPFVILPNGETWVQPEVWRTIIGLRLGKQYFTGTHICPTCAEGNYRSPRNLDTHGHHASVCPGKVGAVRRHNALRDMIVKEISKVPVSIYPQPNGSLTPIAINLTTSTEDWTSSLTVPFSRLPHTASMSPS